MVNTPDKPVKLVPFVCPVCAASNAVHLITLSRAGGTECVGCARWLKSAVVMRAMHSPRDAAGEAGRRAAAAARPAADQRRGDVVWPPTAESRAAATPLRRRA